MRKPRRYINRKVYFDDGDGAISGRIIKNKQLGVQVYHFMSENGEGTPISFHGKERITVKDGVLEKKLKK